MKKISGKMQGFAVLVMFGGMVLMLMAALGQV
jgi:hypothetical protein